jgi:hypothetical protein
MLARLPTAALYLQLMFGPADGNSNLQDLTAFLEHGHLLPLPPALGIVSDQTRRDAFSSLMVFLQQNDEYLALDRFLQYIFGLDDNTIRNYLMSGNYDGIEPLFLRDWYGRENYMDGFLSRTLRASMIPDDDVEIVENRRVIVRRGAREGFHRLERAFIACNIYHPAQVQQNAVLTSDSSNAEW